MKQPQRAFPIQLGWVCRPINFRYSAANAIVPLRMQDEGLPLQITYRASPANLGCPPILSPPVTVPRERLSVAGDPGSRQQSGSNDSPNAGR